MQHAALGQEARRAGLRSDVPSLEDIGRRRVQLWILLGLLVVVVGAALLHLVLGDDTPIQAPPRLIVGGLLAVVVAFCGYTIEKEIELRKLGQRLMAERALVRELQDRLDELEGLLEAGQTVNAELDLPDQLQRILGAALRRIDAIEGAIFLLEDGAILRPATVEGLVIDPRMPARIGEGLVGKVALRGEPKLFTGPSSDPDSGDRAAMAVPLVHRDTLVGVMTIVAPPSGTFDEVDLHALALFGEHAATSIATARLHEEHRVHAVELAHRAYHDALTELPNRLALLDCLGHALSADRLLPMAVLLIDLDDFKRINETEGHHAGDELLRAVAAMLPDLVDETDMCARIGGDEFAVLLDEVKSADEALQAAERVLSGLRRGVLLRSGVQPVRASAGVALADLSVKNAQDVLRDADVAMYTAKARRKGTARVFEPVMHKAMVERLQLETELERAVELAQLELHYQPIVSLVDGHIAAVETFVRWNHPERGRLAADEFMPIAEETGLVVGIDRWVLLKACAQVRTWQDRFPSDEPLAVAVNLSLRQLESDHVVDLIRLALDVSRLAPQHLILELGEASMVREDQGTIGRLRALNALGIRIALEDAGVGYSSVSELRELPIDFLKINQSIIDGMGRSQEDDGIVAAILSLTDSLGLTSVAQGVERPDQSQRLAELHCDLAQGWHISRPLVDAEMEELLQSRKAALNMSVFREALDEAVF